MYTGPLLAPQTKRGNGALAPAALQAITLMADVQGRDSCVRGGMRQRLLAVSVGTPFDDMSGAAAAAATHLGGTGFESRRPLH